MKTISYVLLVIFFMCLSLMSCSNSTNDKIIGTWSGTDTTGKTATFVFNDNGSIRMLSNGVGLDDNSVGAKMTWQLDASKKPMFLDIIISKPPKEKLVMPMIIRFINDNKIEIKRLNDFIGRPTGFSESPVENQMILVKQ